MFEIISWWEVASIPDGRRSTVCQISFFPTLQDVWKVWAGWSLLCSYVAMNFFQLRLLLWFTGATLRPVALMSCLFLLLFLKCHGNVPLPGNISVELWQAGCTTHQCLPSSDMTMTSFQQFTWWRNIWHWLPVVVLDYFTTCQYSELERPCVIAIVLDSVKQTEDRTLWKNTEKLNLYFSLFFPFLFNPPCVFCDSGASFDQCVFAWGGNSLFWWNILFSLAVLMCIKHVHRII